MPQIEWETTAKRQEVATILRQLADGLSGNGEVELEHGGWELKVQVAEEVDLEVELEIEGGETELEIELKWKSG